MKKENLKNLIKEAITELFLKNSDLQQLNNSQEQASELGAREFGGFCDFTREF